MKQKKIDNLLFNSADVCSLKEFSDSSKRKDFEHFWHANDEKNLSSAISANCYNIFWYKALTRRTEYLHFLLFNNRNHTLF